MKTIHPNQKIIFPTPFCGKQYKGQQGVAIHISRAHPCEHRAKVAARQPNWNNTSTVAYANADIVNKSTDTIHEVDSLPVLSQPTVGNKDLAAYKLQMHKWKVDFQNVENERDFNNKIETFSKFLSKAIYLRPGPKHPATRYYEARKTKRACNTQSNFGQSSNPMRRTKRGREKRKAQYQYQLSQFLFYNQRRKAVRRILKNDFAHCTSNINDIHSHYSSQFSIPNNCVRQAYDSDITEADRITLDETEITTVTKNEVAAAVNRMAVDTAPGPDQILVRAIKDDICFDKIALIATFMISNSVVPLCFTKARTILIYKSGDPSDLSNWRPITICSILRRVIERILDRRLRSFITLSESQRGFTNSPGCLINTSILSSILSSAKQRKKSVSLVFLDIRKAFDNVGHDHFSRTLSSQSVPSKLAKLIILLQSGNSTQIEASRQITKPISIQRGVMQGSPISPISYNMSTNHILEELNEVDSMEEHGYSLVDSLPNITVLAFADDTLIVGKDAISATVQTEKVLKRFHETGLDTNLSKPICINVVDGILSETPLLLNDGGEISAMRANETVRCLGFPFMIS